MSDYGIGKLMEEMEKELIISMKRNLSRHLKEESKVGFEFPQWQAMKLKEMKKYQRENKSIIDNYTKGLSKDISNHLKKELTQGAKKSIKEYNGFAPTKIRASKTLNNSFFKTNDRKVNALIKVVNNDLKTAYTSALRMTNDEYRQVVHKSAFFLANGIVSPQKAIDMATKDFLSRGINCIEYKDGRRINIASYSQMAVRTASLRAQLMGEGDFRESIGRHLVIATASNAACPLCSKWEDKVLIDDVYSGGSKKDGNYPLLSNAMKQGFLHPNCRDSVATYYPELEDINKSYENGKDGSESDIAYQEDLNYINRRIKQFERLALGSIDKENILYYESKKQEWIKQNNITESIKKVYDEYINNGYENLSIIDSNGNQLGEVSTINSISTVKFSDKQLEIMKKYHRKLISIHNHTTNNTFSLTDIYSLFTNESLNSIILTTKKYDYYLRPTLKDLNIINENFDDFCYWFEEEIGKFHDDLLNKKTINEINHIAYKEIFKKLGWKYERRRK